MFGKTESKKQNKSEEKENPPEETPSASETVAEEIVKTEAMKQKLSINTDIVFDEVIVDANRKYSVVFVDGMVNSQMVDNYILKPLIQEETLKEAETEQALIDLIMLGTVYHCQRKKRDKLSECFSDLLTGSVGLVFDESKTAVTFEIKGFDKRGLSEPTNENVLKGAKEAFIEVLRTNTALIRRRIPTSSLIIKQMSLGKRTNTAVSVIYLDGLANPCVVDEINTRLEKIDIDAIVSPGVVESYLIDRKASLFPQILYTERADKFCANIMEGRVGIMIDGFPLAMIDPVDISSFLQAPEDYSQNFIYSSMYRIMRYFCFSISLVLPAFYVSITTFHQQMIPPKLATAIIQSKEGIPLPSYLEVILMLIAFEVLLEAGMRLPKSVGQAVSIVGALVVGQAAITAKMLSPGVVIVVAAAGIMGFVIPSQDFANSLRVCRLILVGFSITSGLYGLSIGVILIIYHLSDMEVFGVPYLSPFVSTDGKGMLNDTIFRIPWRKMKKRPANISPQGQNRQA